MNEMKINKIISLIILLLMISSVNANIYSEIENKAFELKQNTTIDTIYAVDNYVEARTIDKYNKYPVNFFDFWRTGIGDCTDKMRLKKRMLKTLDIKTRSVYGIVYIKGNWYRHDWYEFNINGTFENIEYEMFNGLKKYDNGRW